LTHHCLRSQVAKRTAARIERRLSASINAAATVEKQTAAPAQTANGGGGGGTRVMIIGKQYVPGISGYHVVCVDFVLPLAILSSQPAAVRPAIQHAQAVASAVNRQNILMQ
jgi:hypothetical protein